MPNLTTKVQYKGFLPGQFVEEAKRSFDETIRLIEEFPWVREWEKIGIELTNPSVTMENKNGEFLKLAPYFNNKFVLHFLNREQKLYAKSFVKLEDTYPYLQLYFNDTEFKPDGFEKDKTWESNTAEHFISREYQYIVTPKKAWRYFLKNAAWGLAVALALVCVAVFDRSVTGFKAFSMILPVFMCLIPLLFFLNYYKYAKGKILIMPFNSTAFYFGNIDNPTLYRHEDIASVTLLGLQSSYNRCYKNEKPHLYNKPYFTLMPESDMMNYNGPFCGFRIIKIEFRDGTTISIPNNFGVKYFHLGDRTYQRRNTMAMC